MLWTIVGIYVGGFVLAVLVMVYKVPSHKSKEDPIKFDEDGALVLGAAAFWPLLAVGVFLHGIYRLGSWSFRNICSAIGAKSRVRIKCLHCQGIGSAESIGDRVAICHTCKGDGHVVLRAATAKSIIEADYSHAEDLFNAALGGPQWPELRNRT
jgi:hypothetical protein